MQPSTAGLYPCHGAGVWTTPTLMLQEPTTLTTDRGVKRPCFRDLVKVNGQADGGPWGVAMCRMCWSPDFKTA